MQLFINHNGNIKKEPAGKDYPYAFGIFETMKLNHEKLRLGELHFERLTGGLNFFNVTTPGDFTMENLLIQINELQQQNNCNGKARVRLTVQLEKNNSPFDYTIECSPLEQREYSELSIDIYEGTRKEVNAMANYKTTHREVYEQCASYSKENDLDDCLVLNEKEHICDSSISNVFWIKKDILYTPPLSEGCVAGVVRRHILSLNKKNILGAGIKTIEEKIMTVQDVSEADEVFLTNAIRGIQTVKKFRDISYSTEVCEKISGLLFV